MKEINNNYYIPYNVEFYPMFNENIHELSDEEVSIEKANKRNSIINYILGE